MKPRKRRSTTKNTELKKWLIPRLRRISRCWPEANEAMRASKVFRAHHRCASCKGIFHYKNVQRDHIEPIVRVTGFTDWNDYILRLFCSRDKYQILCITCHSQKTLLENEERMLPSK